MTVLLERDYRRTLDDLVEHLPARVQSGETVEVWCFESLRARRAAEMRLAEAGVSARIRCAYKPLCHAFLEEFPREGLTTVEVATPQHRDAVEGRFALEAYPLAAMLGGATLRFAKGTSDLDYVVTLTADDGTTRRCVVFAPNVVRIDHTGAQVLAPSGWLRVGKPGERPRIDEPISCDVERLFLDVMAAVTAHAFPVGEPCFDRLVIEADIPTLRQPLGFGDEVADMAEALHEDLYFSILEFFVKRSGRTDGARDLRIGQIVPLIRSGDGPVQVVARLEPFETVSDSVARGDEALEHIDAPIAPARVAAALAALCGETFAARSREGRLVQGVFCDGRGPGVAISGGQHANEPTGIVGALRAAAALKAAGRRFAVTPLENPDGYALHARLCRDNPSHMHHAARYTALGDDLGHRQADGRELFELAARREAFARAGAQLHINLHGYPSHEWTRPFTGYVPRSFALWAVPKGFFLIARHQDGWGEAARTLLERVASRLAAELPEMVALNAAQIAAYRAHVGAIPFDVIAGIPCQIGGPTRATAPIEIITEYPDETIHGRAFRLGHACQFRAAMAAAEIFAEMTPVA